MRAPLVVLLLVTACSTSAPEVGSPSLAPTSPSTSSTPAPTPSPPLPLASSPSPSAPSARPTASAAPYRWSARRVTARDLPHSWRPGCPVPPSRLRLLTLPYRDFGGARRTGEIVVNASVVDDVVDVFRTLYRAGFPIRSLRVVDEYGGSDDRSMAADNTSGFNCRDAVGGSGWSRHAYGLAIDVNPRENPYLYGGKVLPPEGAAYTDRTHRRKGMAYPGSVVNRAFAAQGWSWGGRWRNPDYQHFSKAGE